MNRQEQCFEELRAENAGRPQTERDEIARELTELLGSDIDGAQAMMDDLREDRPGLQQRLLTALSTLREQPEVDAEKLAAIGELAAGDRKSLGTAP